MNRKWYEKYLILYMFIQKEREKKRREVGGKKTLYFQKRMQ